MGPPNTLPDQAPVATDDAIMATTLYKLLMQFSTPKGIRVEIDRSMWPKADGLPEKVQGRVEQWVNKAKMQLKITWVEPSGEEKFDVDALHDLLPHNFKLVLGPRGEKLLLRGAARFEAACRRSAPWPSPAPAP